MSMSKKAASLELALLLISFFTAVSMASWINTDYGNVKVQSVLIPADGFSLEGLLYIHPEAHPDNPKPAIIVTHGISNAKEAVSGIALELAREGFVALALDLVGHGTSGGRLSVDDPSFGVAAALEYLRSLDYVDRGMVGLVGHSLGAGAVRRVAEGFGVEAVVFIGGGIGGMSEEGAYGSLSPTFPRNLLVVVGVHDILFYLEELDAALRPVFDTEEVIVPGKYYGDFMMGTSRRLVTPATIHLLEPVDPFTVREVVFWMIHVMKPWSSVPPRSPIYVGRDLAILAALAALIGLVHPVSNLSAGFLRPRSQRVPADGLGGWHVFLGWGCLGLALFIPMMHLGALVPFPPLLFGSSMAWWLLASALSGLLVLWLLKRRTGLKERLGDVLREACDARDALFAIGVFLFIYLIVWFGETFFGISLTIIVPIFRGISSLRRLAAFLAFLPFYASYFFVDGLYLYRFRGHSVGGVRQLIEVLGSRVGPYLLALFLQYGGMYIAGLRAFPGFLGFFIEFLLAIVPLLVISTVISWWLYGLSSRIGAGFVLNSLLFAWVSSTLFPFGALP